MCVGGLDSSCHVHIVHAAGPAIVSLPAVRSTNQPSSTYPPSLVEMLGGVGAWGQRTGQEKAPLELAASV